MSWRIAESLKKLREQINAEWPKRDKASDGGIGDERHASSSSDHNPWVKDVKGQPIVTAIDIDEDLAPSINSIQFIVDAIIKSRDKRVKYIIYEGRICSSYPTSGYPAWAWRPYSGTKNPHKHHAHISVQPTQSLFDSRAEWSIGIVPAKKFVDEPVILEIPPAMPIAIAPKTEEPIAPLPIIVKDEAPAPPTPPADTVEIRKERPSTFVKIGAAVTAAIGFVTNLGVNIGTFVDRATEGITAKQVFFTTVGLGLVAAALWFYDRSATRANKLNSGKLSAAADTGSNTVDLND